MLFVGRIIQGVTGPVVPVTLLMLRNEIQDPKRYGTMMGVITAVNYNTGKIKWQVKTPEPMIGGILATAGGLVFTGEGNGKFAAYNSSRNGQWQNPVYANPAVDELIVKGRAETNEETRKAIYGEFQKLVVEDAPDLFGYNYSQMFALRDTLTGYVFCPVGSTSLDCFPLSLA